MEIKKFAVILALFLVFASGNMSMMTGQGQITAYPGETIDLSFQFTYDDVSWFGSSVRILQDEYQFGGADRVIWSGTVSNGETRTVSYGYAVPNEPGDYVVKYELQAGSKWTTCASHTVSIKVIPEPAPQPDPEPDTPADTGTGTDTGSNDDTGTDTDTTASDELNDEVETVVLQGSLYDKIVMLIRVVIAFLTGSTA